MLPLLLAASLVLVQNGQPVAEIVLPGKPSAAEQTAASQLRYWVKEITGAGLTVSHSPPQTARDPGTKPPRLFIGPEFAKERYPHDLAKLEGTEGFAIRRDGNDLYLFGAMGCGTIFAVYELLERNTDIIWPAYPAEIDRVFTKTNNLVINAADTLQIPSVARRGFGHEMTPRAHYFYLRNRAFGGEGNFPYIRFGFEEEDWNCHTLGYLKWEKYKETHPEYFCLIDGNRVEPGWHANLCFTAPGCAEAFAGEFLEGRIRHRRPIGIYGIGIEDTGATCECPGCLKPIPLADGKTLTIEEDPELFKSARFFLWLNRVTKAINRECPDVRIAAIAYLFTLRPPPVELNPNIVINYAPSSKNMREDFLGKSNTRWFRALDDWSKRFRGLSFFEYWGDGAEYPKPVSYVIARDLKINLERGTRRIWSEWTICGDAGYVSALEFWVTARLMWNANADVGELRAEFLKRTFRSAADEMRKFYDIVRDDWFKQPGASTWADKPVPAMRHLMKDPARELAMFTALSNAVAKADHPVSRTFAEGILSVMEKYAAEVRKTADAVRGVVIPRTSAPWGLDSDEGASWADGLLIGTDVFTAPYPATNGCVNAAPAVCAVHDGSNLWVRLRAPLPSVRWDVSVQPVVRGKDFTFTVFPDGTARAAEGWERKYEGEWKASVFKQDDRWSAILRIPLDHAQLKDSTLRLLFSHIGADNELVSWEGGRAHHPSMFVKVKLGE